MIRVGLSYLGIVWQNFSIWPYLRWSGWALCIFGLVCFVAAAIEHSLQERRKWAIWLDRHSPVVIRIAGMRLSQLGTRFIFVLLIGFLLFCLFHGVKGDDRHKQSDRREKSVQEQYEEDGKNPMPGPASHEGAGAPRR